ncbi:MAG: RES family NAD+ phosphorylase [Coriobacteriales bacterium]|nr:RES family NAD+ phosphorylase [Coriobacteriales bacterium]
MKADSKPGNFKYDGQHFDALLKFSTANSHLVSELNLTALGIFMEGVGRTVESSSPDLNANMQRMLESLHPIAMRYNNLVPRENLAIVPILEQISLSTAALLSSMPKTELSSTLTDCFAQARYDAMPSVLSQALSAETLAASDVAFMKLSKLTLLMDNRIAYPKGFKTSLNWLNVQTAADLSTGLDVSYDTRDNLFRHGESAIDSRGLNVVSAGKAIIRDENAELFSESELIDFVSELSAAPMMGMMASTGKRIYDWLKNLYQVGNYSAGLERDVYYHCRARDKDDMPFTFDEMKAAPHGIPGAGRFNMPGTACYYFASTQDGAESEVTKYLRKGEVLQTARIVPRKSRDITMLDLSHTLQRGKTFLRMIRFRLSDESQASKLPREYLLPCFVADCCKTIGFDGIAYHGSKNHTNYVVWSDGWFSCDGMC